jgi:hypothetical protein
MTKAEWPQCSECDAITYHNQSCSKGGPEEPAEHFVAAASRIVTSEYERRGYPGAAVTANMILDLAEALQKEAHKRYDPRPVGEEDAKCAALNSP